MLTFVFPTLLAFFASALLPVISLALAMPHLSFYLPRSLSPIYRSTLSLAPANNSLSHALYLFWIQAPTLIPRLEASRTPDPSHLDPNPNGVALTFVHVG